MIKPKVEVYSADGKDIILDSPKQVRIEDDVVTVKEQYGGTLCETIFSLNSIIAFKVINTKECPVIKYLKPGANDGRCA